MASAAVSEDDFIAAWRRFGSARAVANHLKQAERVVHARRRAIEARQGIQLEAFNDLRVMHRRHQGRVDLDIENGTVIVFSDAHFWPGFKTTANRALVAMLRQMAPKVVICNGDAFDGATISRFPRPFFDEAKPSVVDELKVCDERLDEIAKAAGTAKRIWTLGNHDLRFEARLAASNPEYQNVRGFHLKDHFPDWTPAWSCWINNDAEIRHRIRGGVHATWNNLHANHCTTVTGHLHALQVRPYTDGRGIIKYGVDTGTLADIDGPQFTDYLEGRTPAWRSGFVVLTWRDGTLLMPELVMKHDEDHVQFRGHVLHADTLEI